MQQKVSLREHTYISRSNRLECTVMGAGQTIHPVFMQSLARDVEGEVRIRLEKPEPVSAIRIRLKCVIRSCVCPFARSLSLGLLLTIQGKSAVRAHGSGRHPIVDEITLIDVGQILYESFEPDVRLQGSRAFPYCLRFPEHIANFTSNGQRVPIPPSFSLSNSNTDLDVSLVYISMSWNLLKSNQPCN